MSPMLKVYLSITIVGLCFVTDSIWQGFRASTKKIPSSFRTVSEAVSIFVPPDWILLRMGMIASLAHSGETAIQSLNKTQTAFRPITSTLMNWENAELNREIIVSRKGVAPSFTAQKTVNLLIKATEMQQIPALIKLGLEAGLNTLDRPIVGITESTRTETELKARSLAYKNLIARVNAVSKAYGITAHPELPYVEGRESVSIPPGDPGVSGGLSGSGGGGAGGFGKSSDSRDLEL